MEKNADITIRNNEGKTPCDVVFEPRKLQKKNSIYSLSKIYISNLF